MYHIGFNGDEKYIPYICVVINSIVQNTQKEKSYKNDVKHIFQQQSDWEHSKEAYHFHILIDKLSETTKEKIKNLEKALNILFPTIIEWHILDDRLFADYPQWRKSYAAYYRILLARFIPENIDRVLYLDGDMLVNTDLRQLFALNMEGKGLACVPNYPQLWHELKNKKGQNPYSFKEYVWYFNSGFMLIDLAQWRKQNTEKQVIDFLNTYEVICPDQDALNAVYKDNIKLMPYKWNLMWNNMVKPEYVLSEWQEQSKKCGQEYIYIYLISDIENPCIIHYSVKPWNSNGFRVSAQFEGFYYPNIDLWWQMAEKTPSFAQELLAIKESSAYQKMLKENVKQEKLLANPIYVNVLKLKRNTRPFFKKLEQPFKIVRNKIRAWKKKREKY